MRRFLGLLASSLMLTAGIAATTSRYDHPPSSQTFLDRQGKVIGTLNAPYNGLQIWTPLDKIPTLLMDITLQKEDRFFFWHNGVNPAALFKSAVRNILQGKVVRGGSTLTQQLARNLIQEKEQRFFSRTLFNKFREMIVAFGLELRHSKKWILERYLNSVYYGNRCYGIAAAAQTYFGKNLDGLTRKEADLLSSLPRSPSKAPSPPASINLDLTARHFVEWVGTRSPKKPVVPTTLDLDLQREVENGIRTLLEPMAKEDPLVTSAAVVIDVKTGDLLSMVGSRDYADKKIEGEFNAAVAPRQPGSALKPFVYFAAFAKGFSPETLVPDEPMSFSSRVSDDQTEAYIPQNFDRRYHGSQSIRTALANSFNVPAVATLNETGISFYLEILRRFGLTTINKTPKHYGLSLVLGAGEVNLLELTNAYAALAREGFFLPVRFLKEKGIPSPRAVLPDFPLYAREIAAILSDEKARLPAFGFNEDMKVEGHTVAVKTGTSHNRRDLWAVGFDNRYAVGIWLGHADATPLPAPTRGPFGADPNISAPRLWHAVMEKLLRGKKGEPTKLASTNTAFDQNRLSVLPSLENSQAWRIRSPLPHARYRVLPYLPEEHQKILAEVSTKEALGGTLHWFLDEKLLGKTGPLKPDEKGSIWIKPEEGSHILRVEAPDGTHQTVPFTILEES